MHRISKGFHVSVVLCLRLVATFLVAVRDLFSIAFPAVRPLGRSTETVAAPISIGRVEAIQFLQRRAARMSSLRAGPWNFAGVSLSA